MTEHKGLERAVQIGALLIEVKRQLPHGQWLPWLAEHCPHISRRTAQIYMQVARFTFMFEAVSKAQEAAHLKD
jgi:Protein of unknown function (DUF3102)